MKFKLLFLIFVLIIPIVSANVECSKVFAVNFNYDNGVISYKEKVIKCGYAPDRLLQPEEGYTAEMISMDNKPLYSFKFKVPLNFNFDLSDPVIKKLSGGMLILNATDFALIFPYYDEVKSIVIYNPRKYKVLEVPLIEEQFIQKRTWWRVLFLIVLVVAVYMVYRHYKKPRQPVQQYV